MRKPSLWRCKACKRVKQAIIEVTGPIEPVVCCGRYDLELLEINGSLIGKP